MSEQGSVPSTMEEQVVPDGGDSVFIFEVLCNMFCLFVIVALGVVIYRWKRNKPRI